MKKSIALVIAVVLLTACTSRSSDVSVDEVGSETAAPYSETGGGAPPAAEFGSIDEAVEEIRAIRAAGPEKMVRPSDFKIYEKDHIYLLKDVPPLPGFSQEAVMLTLEGTAILYYKNEWKYRAAFFWFQGYDTPEKSEELTNRYGLEPYGDTKFFLGKDMGDTTFIIWWENGDQFSFEYPSDTEISPEEIIEYLEVVKYDLW